MTNASDDWSAPHHRARCQTRLHIAALDVADRPSLLLEQSEFDRRPDVKNDRDE